MADEPILDLSKSTPVSAPDPNAGITLDLSKSTPVADAAPNSQAAFDARRAAGIGKNPALNTGAGEANPADPNPQMHGTGPTGAAGVASGFGHDIVKTASGVSKLANTALGGAPGHDPLSQGLSALGGQTPDQMDLENNTTSQKVGGLAESTAEYAAGDAALGALSKLVKAPTALLEMIEKYPKAAKLITGMTKGATVGGAQGAARGSAEGDAAGGAKSGAIGGAVGSGVAEGISPGIKALGRVFGLGLDSTEALMRGVKPSVPESANFQKALKTAAEPIVEANEKTPIKTVGDFEDLLHKKANEIRTQVFQPMIDRNAKKMLSAQPVAQNIRAAITDQMREYNPEQAEEIENFARLFAKDMPLAKAEQDLQYFNAELKKFYAANRVDQAAALKTNGTVAKYEAAADGLRDVIYSNLRAFGEDAPEKAQAQYGALKQLERSVGKRATVSERQNPINITEVLTLAGGAGAGVDRLLTGHPLEAVVAAAPFVAAHAAKIMNSSDSLVKRGLQTMGKEVAGKTGPSALGSAAGTTAKAVTGEAGVQAGQDLGSRGQLVVRTVDGGVHTIPADQWDAVKAEHPETELLHGTPISKQ